MLFAFRILGAVIVLVTQVFLARTMGAHDLGIYAFVFSICIILAMIAGIGYPPASTRFIGRYIVDDDRPRMRGFIRRGRQFVVGTGLVIFVLGLILILLPPWPFSPDYRYPLIVALLGAPVFALIHFHARVSNAFSWHQLAFLPGTVARPLLFLIVIWVMWTASGTLTVGSAMISHVTMMVLVCFVQFVWLNRSLGGQSLAVEPAYETRAWTRVALPLMIVELFNQYSPELAIVLSGLFLPAAEIGVMNVGFRIALVIAFGIAAIDTVTLPRVSRLYAQGDRQAIQRLITRTTQIKFWAALGALVVLTFWGKSFLGLFGQEFVRGYMTLMIIASAQLLVAAIGPVGPLLSITGHQDRCLYVYASCLAVMLVLMFLIAPVFGMEGAAVVVLLTMTLWQVWMYLLVVSHLGIKPAILSFGRALP